MARILDFLGSIEWLLELLIKASGLVLLALVGIISKNMFIIVIYLGSILLLE